MKNYTKLFTTFSVLILVSIMSSSLWAKASLTKIRIGQSVDKTRVVFEVKKNHRFDISRLHNPPRLVVDFYKTDNKISFKQKKFLDSRLGKIRIKNQKKRTRVVLDLRKDFDYSYFTLGKNKRGAERVVVDLSKDLVKAKKVQKSAQKSVRVKHAKASVKPKSNLKYQHPLALKTKSKSSSKSKPQPVIEHQQKDLVIAIDPGHGGKDTGAIGHNNLLEKVVVLELARKLKKYIDAQPGMKAVMTRDKDEFIPLYKRVRIAHKKNADIFLSLHADSFKDKSARGGSVYILSTKGASSVMARLLAKTENASLKEIKLKGRDSDVAFLLSDLARTANIRASRKLGEAVLGEMGLSVHLHKSSVQAADFAVLKSIDIPSLLIETAFVSNPSEAKKLKSSRFQTKMAKSIVRGLTKFAKRNSQQPRWGESLYVKYKVQAGDTLSQIADNYGISVKKLKKINKIKHANKLYVGKKLKIPVSDEVLASL